MLWNNYSEVRTPKKKQKNSSSGYMEWCQTTVESIYKGKQVFLAPESWHMKICPTLLFIRVSQFLTTEANQEKQRSPEPFHKNGSQFKWLLPHLLAWYWYIPFSNWSAMFGWHLKRPNLCKLNLVMEQGWLIFWPHLLMHVHAHFSAVHFKTIMVTFFFGRYKESWHILLLLLAAQKLSHFIMYLSFYYQTHPFRILIQQSAIFTREVTCSFK